MFLPFSKRQILRSSKLKEFAEDNSNFDENGGTATVHIIHVFPGVHQYLAMTVKHIAQGLFLVKPRGSSYNWATQGPPFPSEFVKSQLVIWTASDYSYRLTIYGFSEQFLHFPNCMFI